MRGARKRIFQVATYHRVSPVSDGVFDPVHPAVFEMQVGHLARHYTVLQAAELARLSQEGGLPPRAVAITFDDGYEDNFQYAFPILRRLGIPATVFLATGAIGTGNALWHDVVFAAFAESRQQTIDVRGHAWTLDTPQQRWRATLDFVGQVHQMGEAERDAAIEELCARLEVPWEAALRRSPMLNWDQARHMAAAGVEFGGHTVTHPILSRLPSHRQAEEIEASLRTISAELGAWPRVFAYPNGREGDFDETTVDVLRQSGVEAAFTTCFGSNSIDSDPYRLRRGIAWDSEEASFSLRMAGYHLVS